MSGDKMNENLTVDVSGMNIRKLETDEQDEIVGVLLEGGVDELVDLCKRYFKTLGTVPKISTEDNHMIMRVVQFKSIETRRYFSFDNAFELVNDWPLKDLDPTIYVHRPKGKVGDRYVEASPFHLQAKDDKELSLCRAVGANLSGYQLVLKPKPVLESRTCTNCLQTKTIKE